ncbi:unnamed protein product [Spodoptera littoralis]|uniref:Uncharacterized protein n=1 Tax=Spodoptera littoralis TaxID=7109 RepID=A0A9P0NAI6_SPOLI|nr:unnamed protein product [Spodoptera littoralis]CAH1647368.1 unnamed protein product [Spodoptera littoralis]
MASLVRCHKCKKDVNIKSTALCSACENRYEFDCDGYPEPTYRLKDPEAKKKWRCKLCIRNKKYAINEGVSNITVRKRQNCIKSPSPIKKIPNTKKGSADNTSKRLSATQSDAKLFDSHILTDCESYDESYTTSNRLSRSVDRTVTDLVSVSEMKETIAQLTLQLESTENELGNILLENTELHKQIKKLCTENDTLKSLCHSSSIFGYPGTSSKKKKHALSQPHYVHSTPSSPSSSTLNVEVTDHVNVLRLQQEILNLQQLLQTAEGEISALTERITILMQSQNTCDLRIQETERNPDCIATCSGKQRQTVVSGKKIHIIGTQRCVGLAAALSHSRANTQYEKYQLFALTKPNAPCSEVLSNCRNVKLTTDDKVVICIGENDHNISIILSQLRDILDIFSNNTIIVLNVVNNVFLNVNKINNSINKLCSKYKKCHFVNQISTKLSDICRSINFVIDYSDYEYKYLNPSEIRKRIASGKSSVKLNIEPKKGTIPYYFTKQSQIETVRGPKNNNLMQPNTNIRKGTIPYYFPALNKCESFFRN